MRKPWVKAIVRRHPDPDALRRKGLITEEMEYVARIEKVQAELIRAEVARGA